MKSAYSPLVYLPIGNPGILQINPATSHKDRIELASCILDVVGGLGEIIGCYDELSDDEKCLGWAIAYLNGMGKSLLDSLDNSGARA